MKPLQFYVWFIVGNLIFIAIDQIAWPGLINLGDVLLSAYWVGATLLAVRFGLVVPK